MFSRTSRLWVFSWIKRSTCKWSDFVCLLCTPGQELSASFKMISQLFGETLLYHHAVLLSWRPFIQLKSLLHLSSTEPVFSSDANPFEVNCHHKKCLPPNVPLGQRTTVQPLLRVSITLMYSPSTSSVSFNQLWWQQYNLKLLLTGYLYNLILLYVPTQKLFQAYITVF